MLSGIFSSWGVIGNLFSGWREPGAQTPDAPIILRKSLNFVYNRAVPAQHKLVKVDDSIIAFPATLPDEDVAAVIKKFKQSKPTKDKSLSQSPLPSSAGVMTEESEHARQLAPAQPVGSAIPDWLTQPIPQTADRINKAFNLMLGFPGGVTPAEAEINERNRKANEAFDKAFPLTGGAMMGAHNFAEGLLTPANLMLMLTAPESKLLSAFFATQAMRGSYRDAKEAEKDFKEGKNKEAAQYITQSLLGLGVAGLAGSHAVRGTAVDTSALFPEGPKTIEGEFERAGEHEIVPQSTGVRSVVDAMAKMKRAEPPSLPEVKAEANKLAVAPKTIGPKEAEVKRPSFKEPDLSTAEVVFSANKSPDRLYRGTNGEEELGNILASKSIASTSETASRLGKSGHQGLTFFSDRPNVATSYVHDGGYVIELDASKVPETSGHGAGEIATNKPTSLDAVTRIFKIGKDENGYHAIDVTKQVLPQLGGGKIRSATPEGIREETQHVIGGKQDSIHPLEVVNTAMLALGKNNKVSRIVIQSIPVDVVDVLAKNGFTTKQLFSQYDVVSNALPVDDRATVARGLSSALQLAGTRFRAALDGVLPPNPTGRDKEFLAAVRAVKANPSVLGAFAPFVSSTDLSGDLGLGGGVLGNGELGAGNGAPSAPILGGVDLARVSPELSPAQLAESLNRHGQIIAKNGPTESVEDKNNRPFALFKLLYKPQPASEVEIAREEMALYEVQRMLDQIPPPADPVSTSTPEQIEKWGAEYKAWAQKAAPSLERYKEIAQRIGELKNKEIGEIRKLPDGNRVLYLNRGGLKALYHGLMGGPPPKNYGLSGLSLDVSDIKAITNNLALLKPLLHGELTQMMLRGMDKNGLTISMMPRKGESLSEALATLREELNHGWQRRFADAAGNHLSPEHFANLNVAMPKTMSDYLGTNYPEIKNDGSEVMNRRRVLEASSKMLSESPRSLGLTDDEWAAYLFQYFHAVEAEHGDKALNELLHITALAKEVKNVYFSTTDRFPGVQENARGMGGVQKGRPQGAEGTGPPAQRGGAEGVGLEKVKREAEALQPAAARTDTPEFKTWFKESKVTDESGKPKPVFHSGWFDEKEDPVPDIGENGFHFGTRDAAQSRNGGKLVDDFIREGKVEQYENEDGKMVWGWSSGSEESYDFDEEGFETEAAARRDLEQRATEQEVDEDMPLTEAYLSIQNPKRVKDQEDDWAPAVAKAKREGYDGIVYRNEFEDKGTDSYIAFYPEQIKSVKNEGAHDPSNPNILKSVKRAAEKLKPPTDLSQKATEWATKHMHDSTPAANKEFGKFYAEKFPDGETPMGRAWMKFHGFGSVKPGQQFGQ
jgi:hypothetical protein